MKKVIIIGGGFGGLACAAKLASSPLSLEITLIDKKETADFLPMLPDCLGRVIDPAYLTYRIADFNRRVNFHKAEVTGITLEKKEVVFAGSRLNYDYLVISSGSETNFYAQENIKKYAYKLDDAQDAQKIIRALKSFTADTFIVAGGGYTGVEVATNLKLFLDKQKRSARIIIVERAPAILGTLPAWMRDYVLDNLKNLKIEVFLNSAIERIEEEKTYISEGRIFDNSLVIWAAGVKTAAFIQDLKAEKSPQGRIKVDECLKLNESCFAIGDAACFEHKNTYLRMAVQFSIAQGCLAAENIIRGIAGKALRKYRPLDLGYIIPLANNRSCGKVLGINLKGKLPTLFHFMMCVYRLRGLKNKWGIVTGLMKGG